MARPSFHSHESDPQSFPGRPAEALLEGWDIELEPRRAASGPHAYGLRVHLTSQTGSDLEIRRTVGPVKVTRPAHAPVAWSDEEAAAALGWEEVNASIELAHEAVRNSSRVRVRDLDGSGDLDYGLLVTEVAFERVTKRGQVNLVARGMLCVLQMPRIRVLDLTRELHDPTRTIVTLTDEDHLGVALRDAASLDLEVIAALVRRPEVEGFAGERYAPNELIDAVAGGEGGRSVYVALFKGQPFGFVTLTTQVGSVALMCFIIADSSHKGLHRSASIFYQGLEQAKAHGFRTVVGLTEPPCHMRKHIMRVGGNVGERADGRLEWRVDLYAGEFSGRWQL